MPLRIGVFAARFLIPAGILEISRLAAATGPGAQTYLRPSGAAEGRVSPQIAFIKLDTAALQQFDIFLLER